MGTLPNDDAEHALGNPSEAREALTPLLSRPGTPRRPAVSRHRAHPAHGLRGRALPGPVPMDFQSLTSPTGSAACPSERRGVAAVRNAFGPLEVNWGRTAKP
jgi:hypothetical protein